MQSKPQTPSSPAPLVIRVDRTTGASRVIGERAPGEAGAVLGARYAEVLARSAFAVLATADTSGVEDTP